MLLEDMPPKETILDQVPISFAGAKVANKEATTFSYAAFCNDMIEDRGIDVTKVAKAAGYDDGREYLQDLGLNLNDDGDLIIPSDISTATKAASFIQRNQAEQRVRAERRYYQRQQAVIPDNYQPPSPPVQVESHENDNVAEPFPQPPPVEVHDFDGDESKIMPGMRVRIAGGKVYILPKIPEDRPDDPRYYELRKKAARTHRKKVRELVKLHNETSAAIEKLRLIYQ